MLRVHGLAGEIVVRAHHPASDPFKIATSVVLIPKEGDAQCFDIRSRRPLAKGLGLRLEGVRSRVDAEELKGCAVWIEHAQLEELAEDEFYLEDIRGFDASTPGGEPVGRIKGFMFTNIDIAVIAGTGGREILIPLLDGVIVDVDADNRAVTLAPPEGLLEE